MSWTTMDFDHLNGVRDLLQRLAESPLVRRTLPNAAAICQQYFHFKKDPAESMSKFLVREALGYAEFIEALLMLYEDKRGIRQHEKTFDLPEEMPRDDPYWRRGWRQDDEYYEPAAEDGAANANDDQQQDPRPRPGDAGDGSIGGQSPMRRAGGLPSSAGGNSNGGNGNVNDEVFAEPAEFSLADSFALNVLRGFRLLQSAGLTSEEKRDILSATKGDLDFSVVVAAIQTLWDEQFLGKHPNRNASNSNYFMDSFHVDDTEGYQEWDDTHDTYWGESSWHDSSWDDGGWYDNRFQGTWNEARFHQPEPARDDPPEDQGLQESLQAEKEAEALALQANRTWAEAQRATQALRRDRGFGQSRPTPNDGRCFTCGGDRLARDCPGRRHPGYKGKGKGGKNHYNTEWYEPDIFAFHKGGKFKGSKSKKGSKSLHWLDANAVWKGKGKYRGPTSGCLPVNAYASEMMYGLEMQPEHLDLHNTSVTSKMNPGSALLDCGATASAGPEASVQNLINSIVAADRQTSVTIAKYRRPFFRFGDGKWGQANYQVTVSSSVSGTTRSFTMFCLPNPPEFNSPDFDKTNMVPVLLGMDHLSGRDTPESAITIDFSTGMSLESNNPTPVIQQLPSNSKGHYVRDVVQYLTLGHVNHDGTPSIHVVEGELQSAELQALEFHPVEFYDMAISDAQHDERNLERSRENLLALHAHRHGHAAASATLASMCQTGVSTTPNSKVSASCLAAHGAAGTSSILRAGHREGNQGGNTGQEPSNAFGPGADHGPRRSGSTIRQETMALQGHPQPYETSQQCSWSMGALRCVQSSAELHSKEGKPIQQHQTREPGDGREDAGRAEGSDAWLPSHGDDLSRHAEEDRCRRDLGQHDPQGDSRAAHGCTACGVSKFPKGQGQVDGGWNYKTVTFEAHDELYNNLGSGEQSSGVSERCAGRHSPATSPGGTSHRDSSGCGESGQCLRTGHAVNDKKFKPMTHSMAAKVMLFATTMMATMTTMVTSFALDDRDGLWEVACAPHSWLSQAAEQQGLRPRRINLESGFDLYRPETWKQLHALRRQHRPKRIWFSLPCTKWCPWTSVNYSTDERKEILESYRRRERRMLWHAYHFIKSTLEEDPETLLYWEWPHPCFGWNQAPLLALQDLLQQLGHDWDQCRIDGCRYHMRDKSGDLLKKKWMIKTNDNSFHSQFRAKVCTNNHCHGRIEGQETEKSAYYPWQLVQSIARFWAKQTCSHQQIRRMSHLGVAEVDWCEGELLPAQSSSSTSRPSQPSSPMESTDVTSTSTSPTPLSQQEAERWKVKLTHFHRAAGHCSSRNLARIARDAQLEPWKVRMAADFKCPVCEAIKPGGISSGKVPPAATHAQFGPWEALGLDVAEWTIPGKTTKQKFLLMIDMATRLRMVYPLLDSYDITQIRIENAELVIQAVTLGWLATYPKPYVIVADNAKSFTSEKFADFCRDSGIELSFPAEKEAWAHGLVEHAIKDVKTTASAIQIDNITQDPLISSTLAASALNSTEHVNGFSSHQWAFGRDYTISDEDRRLFSQLGDRAAFASMVAAREKAEQVATTTRSQRILSRLANSKARQPLRQFQIADLVMIWRQVLPAHVHKGPRGGMKKSSRPGWVGPGRVIFTEMLPHQDQDDPRRHIVWVLLQGKLLRCSVHSVRPTTPTEKLHHELYYREDPTKRRSLQDLVPQREYTDIMDEIPTPDQLELPYLPRAPDNTTVVPGTWRARGKVSPGDKAWVEMPRTSPLGLGIRAPTVTPFGLGGSASSSLGPGPGLLPEATVEPPAMDLEPSTEDPVNDYSTGPAARDTPPAVPHPEEPDYKRLKGPENYDLKWIEQLTADAQLEANSGDLYSAFLDTEDFMMITFDLEMDSHRQRKMLERNPVLYLTKKMSGSEVQLARLNEQDKQLFHRAKLKEVDSFLKNQAVRKALNDKELADAHGADRIIKARWVLTWKPISPDETDEAKQDQQTNPKTTVSREGSRKAKARIVLLGYQQPSLLDRQFRTAAPVQSMIGRNMIYLFSSPSSVA